MTIEQIIGAIGQIATWVTVILVFFTLREMEKQRKASQKPELIIPNVPIFGYSENEDDIYVASQWSNNEIKDEGIIVERRPQVTIYNIGAGAAKEIKIKWDFDIQDTVKSIQDYCYRNSIPVVVSNQNNFLRIEYKGRGTFMNIEASARTEHAYLMPASVTSQGLESALPFTFLELASILIFINMHQTQKKSDDKAVFPVEESQFEIPSLGCEISYADIGGETYSKRFGVTFNPYMMRYPSKGTKISIPEPVFHAMFQFEET